MAQPGVPIPVTILSGFLGAGKTTFLNSMIQSIKREGRNVFVVENEYGQENIDSQLVIGADSGLFEFTNGCLCCDLNEDLFDLLLTLWDKRAEFDELIIETTGIADPATVALPFLTNPAVGGAYRLTRVIGLVHARVAGGQESSPSAHEHKHGDVHKDEHGHGHKHDHHHHHDIVSLSFRFTEVFDLEELEFRLMVFLQAQSKDVYRVKGIVNAHGLKKKSIVQSVSHYLGISEGNDWAKGEERLSRIVFIGRKLKPEGFEKMLRACLYSINRPFRDSLLR